MSSLSGTDLSVSCGGCGDFGFLIGTAGSGSGSFSPAAHELTWRGGKNKGVIWVLVADIRDQFCPQHFLAGHCTAKFRKS